MEACEADKTRSLASCRLRSAELHIQMSQRGSLTQCSKIYGRSVWQHRIGGGTYGSTGFGGDDEGQKLKASRCQLCGWEVVQREGK